MFMSKTSPVDFLNPNTEYVKKEAALERFNICEGCPRLKLKFCQECKCFMPAKTWLKDATCPLGKW